MATAPAAAACQSWTWPPTADARARRLGGRGCSRIGVGRDACVTRLEEEERQASLAGQKMPATQSMTCPAHFSSDKVTAQPTSALFGMPRLLCAQRWGPWMRAAGMVVAYSAATATAVDEHGGSFLLLFIFANNALRTTKSSTDCAVSNHMYHPFPAAQSVLSSVCHALQTLGARKRNARHSGNGGATASCKNAVTLSTQIWSDGWLAHRRLQQTSTGKRKSREVVN